jgi:hypothetical protein
MDDVYSMKLAATTMPKVIKARYTWVSALENKTKMTEDEACL